MSEELCFTPATELAARIRRRDLSPIEVVDAFLERIEERNGRLNAYVTVLGEEAREAAREAERDLGSGEALGALHGMPVAIKDLFDYKIGVSFLPGTRLKRSRKGILRTSASVSALVASGTPERASFGKEDKKMYWYNPTTHSSEKVQAPSSDSQAIRMLAGTQDSAEFIKEYCKLRRSGTPLEQALVLVGHEFRLRQPEYQLALRQEIYFDAVEKL